MLRVKEESKGGKKTFVSVYVYQAPAPLIVFVLRIAHLQAN